MQAVITVQIVQQLLNIKCCNSDRDAGLSECFERVTGSLSIGNVFNPSFYCGRNTRIFAFRAIPDGSEILTSFVSIEDETGRTVTNISADYSKELDSVGLIDPKIARINDEMYITFNSGNVPDGNDIFIMKIYPKVEYPKRMMYKGRQTQERNWAFFSVRGEIYALYQVNPLIILRLKHTGQTSWEMEDYYSEETKNKDVSKGLTIGTQLTKLNGTYYFVAHKKISLLRKKIYLGRICSLDFRNKKIRMGRYWLIHSLKSLLGRWPKHNTNLISCTYFSGIQASGEAIKLGYGINDLEAGFSVHDLNDL